MHVDSDAIIIDRQAVHPLFLPWYTQTFKGSWMDGGGGGGGLGGGWSHVFPEHFKIQPF